MRTSAGQVRVSTLEAIGNTPVVELRKMASPDSARVLV